MNAAVSNGGQEVTYSQNTTNPNNSNNLQEKLFNRVAEVLASKGINVDGSGSLSLDLREDGTVEVIGDIKNKDEIESALSEDSETVSILKKGLGISGSKDSVSDNIRSEDTLEISYQAAMAYEEYKDYQTTIYSDPQAEKFLENLRKSNRNIIEQEWFTEGGLNKDDQNEFMSKIQSYLDKLGIDKKAGDVIKRVENINFYHVEFETDGLTEEEHKALHEFINKEYVKNEDGRIEENWFFNRLREAISSDPDKFGAASGIPQIAFESNAVDEGSPAWAIDKTSRDFDKERENEITEFSDRSALAKMLDLPDGINSFVGIDKVKNALSDRIKTRMEEMVTRTEEVLLQNGIVLDEDEEIQLSVDSEGKILVEPNGESIKEKNRALEVEEALNSNADTQKELVGMLTSLDLDERSLARIGKISLTEEAGRAITLTGDELLKDIAEYKYGKSLSELQDSGDEYIKDKEIYNVLNEIDVKKLDTSSKQGENVEIITGNYKISNSNIISNNTEDTLNEIWKPFTHWVNGLLADEKVRYTPDDPAELNLKNFIVEVDEDGKVEIIEAKDESGNDLRGIKKDIFMGKYFKTDIHDKSLELQSIVNQTLINHEYEHNDVDDYEHKVRITGDINTSMEYEVVSPEADRAAAKELKENMDVINEDLNEAFKEKGVLTPIEIKVNEYGKLEADISTLSDTEQDIVDTVLTDINKVVDKSEEEEKEKGNNDKVEQEEKTKAEIEKAKEEKKEVLEERREDAKKEELNKLGKKSAEFNDVEYEKEAKGSDDVISRIEKKVVAETGIEIEDNTQTDVDDLENKSKEVTETSKVDNLPASLRGLEEVVELAKGLKGILAKFHLRDNMLAAIA